MWNRSLYVKLCQNSVVFPQSKKLGNARNFFSFKNSFFERGHTKIYSNFITVAPVSFLAKSETLIGSFSWSKIPCSIPTKTMRDAKDAFSNWPSFSIFTNFSLWNKTQICLPTRLSRGSRRRFWWLVTIFYETLNLKKFYLENLEPICRFESDDSLGSRIPKLW